IAVSVSNVIACGETLRKVPSGVSNVLTPSVVSSRYGVSSWPSGRISLNSKSVMQRTVPAGFLRRGFARVGYGRVRGDRREERGSSWTSKHTTVCHGERSPDWEWRQERRQRSPRCPGCQQWRDHRV